MAINKPSIATSPSDKEAYAFRLEILASSEQPQLGATAPLLDPVDTPNRLYGWYNGSSDMVELFMTNSAGNRYVRVATYND